MNRFFFYTDPAKLPDLDEPNGQKSHEAFGPAGSDGGYDKYRITNIHTADNCPVIAVCDGLICVQPDDNVDGDTVSIVLKPNSQPPFDFPYIKYFIYKGVKRSSLVDSNNQLLDESGIYFLQNIHDQWAAQNGNDLTGSGHALGLGYDKDVTFDVEGNPTPIFTDDDPVDHFFYYPDPNIQLPLVRAGEKIAEFSGTFGFEIVLERLGYEPAIRLARTFENFIEVASIDDPLNEQNTWEPDDAEYFIHWHQKEECLNYIDPCAFYGSFYGSKVFAMENGGREKYKKEEIYNKILKKFVNKNRVYLDIRNDFGFSFNYFKNYGFKVKFVDSENLQNAIEITTNRNNWPITYLIFSEIPGEHKKELYKASLKLPKGDVGKPAVYLSKAIAKKLGRQKRKFKVPEVTASPIEDYLTELLVSFITIDINGQPEFVSNYYRINYYDKGWIPANPPPLLKPDKTNYLNGIFRPLKMRLGINFKENKFRQKLFREEALVNLFGNGGPVYSSHLGIAEDAEHITFFAFPDYFIQSGLGNDFMPDAFTSWVDKSKEEKKPFFQTVLSQFQNKEARKVTLEIEEVPNVINQVDTVRIRNQNFHFLDSFRHNERPEDYIMLILNKADLNQLIQSIEDVTNIEKSLPIFIIIGDKKSNLDNNRKRYEELTLHAHGFSHNGEKVEKTIIPLNQKIYEYVDF